MMNKADYIDRLMEAKILLDYLVTRESNPKRMDIILEKVLENIEKCRSDVKELLTKEKK
jgi:hypothetical protein